MKKWLERSALVLAGAVLGAAVAWAGPRHLWEPEPLPGEEAVITDAGAREDARERRMVRTQERFRTEMNLALIGFMRLLDFRDFAEMGRDLSLIVPVSPGAGRTDVLRAGARRGVRIPRVVVDTATRRRWTELGGRLERLGDAVDPDVRAAFQAIISFLQENPLPSSAELAAIRGSEWARPSVVDRWVDLNDSLSAAVAGVMSRFGAAP